MWSKSLFSKLQILTLILSISSLSLFAQDVESGKTIFRNQCGSCHNKDMKSKMTGPALGGVEDRWAAYPREDLYSWIRNSQAMIASGHPRATELWAEYKPTVMNNFPTLTDAELENIIAYINDVVNGAGKAAAVPAGGDLAAADGAGGKEDNTLMYIALFAILGVLAVVLARVIANLNYMSKVQAGESPEPQRSLLQTLTSKSVIGFGIFALVLLGGYTTVNSSINLGRQQGYKPDQPIKFSHKTHAGLNKIDCNYCHDGARRSKHSVIPATNTCMNCHSAIKVGSTYGTAEITKIYASVGWDPATGKYIEGYDKMKETDIEKVYTKWIADNYIQEKGKLDAEGERIVKNQWEEIVSSLKTEDKPTIYGPIEWPRIHNLADHAYFNHAQHVTVGKVECQQCHGKVEEMDVVYQYSPLSMGWCINCHRETEVKFSDNEYYKSYERYHDEIKAGTRDKVTVEEIGGLECQKCHY